MPGSAFQSHGLALPGIYSSHSWIDSCALMGYCDPMLKAQCGFSDGSGVSVQLWCVSSRPLSVGILIYKCL